MRRDARARGGRGRATALLLTAVLVTRDLSGQTTRQLQRGRLQVVSAASDATLAASLLRAAMATDTFPGLPRPVRPVRIEIAPTREAFRRAVGEGTPEWGSAFAFPLEGRIVLQGSRAGSDAGDPAQVLRHELAHLALHEFLGDRPPRWFDEGYASVAAGEWGRDEALAANIALVWRRVPTFEQLDAALTGGPSGAGASYALAYRAVADLATIDRERGLALLLTYWPAAGSLDQAVRQSLGITLGSFEKQWRARTRRRYGGLAAAADLAVITAVLAPLLLPLYVSRRRRDRERLLHMKEREARVERLRDESIAASMLEGPPSAATEGDAEGSAGTG